MKNDNDDKNKKHATTEGTVKNAENTENEQWKTVVARNGELEAQVKRTLADYQNLEKRSQEEKYYWIKTANKELLLRLLPVLDTLTLAHKHAKDESLSVSIQQFLDVLKGEGVTRVETKGKEFDPKTMECVVTEDVDPTTASGQEGKVLEELRTGYMLRDMVLRPAQVKVGKGK